jgi:hypothetical protein
MFALVYGDGDHDADVDGYSSTGKPIAEHGVVESLSPSGKRKRTP